MKNLILAIFTVLAMAFLHQQCANPRPPQGGPKDTIPPNLIKTIPPQGTIHFDAEEITLIFDERVNADKLQSNLIITPQMDIKYKTIVKKEELIIKFEEPFPDSTTVTLNFFDGVTDITERTPAVNLNYVFSTGDFLDSLQVSGTVSTLMKNKPEESITVGLYAYTDTLDIFKEKPTYFITTDEEGLFKINNIKNGQYRLVAFKDENRNLLFDASIERYGFLPDIIQLDSNINNLQIKSQKLDASNLISTAARPVGRYYIVRFTKKVHSFSTNNNIPFNLEKDSTSVRFYRPDSLSYSDSIQTIYTAKDVLNNALSDTVFVKFTESDRKPAEYAVTISPPGKLNKVEDSIQLTFTKPVNLFDSALIRFKLDSTLSYALDSTTRFEWNNNHTNLSFNYSFDTTQYYKDQLALFQQDTAAADSLPDDVTFSKINGIDLFFPKETFISIEQDTLAENLTKQLTFPKSSETGLIIINVNTQETHYILQLINKNFKVIRSLQPASQIRLNKIPPGKYGIRVLIDENRNGTWDQGNIREFIAPEQIYLHPDFTELRANWDITLDISF